MPTRRGAEHLTSDTQVSFPFEDDCGVPEDVSSLFADCSVVFGQGVELDGAYVTSVRIEEWLEEGVADDFDSTDSTDSTDGGEPVRSHVSVRVAVSHGDGSETCVVVADTAWRAGQSPFVVTKPVDDGFEGRRSGTDIPFLAKFVVDADALMDAEPVELSGRWPLSDSCCVPSARSVRSVSIWNSVAGEFPEPTMTGISGDVALLPGYNMSILASTYDGRNGVRFAAIPGAGEGRVPCECDEDGTSYSGNLRPDQRGDVAIIPNGGCLAVTGSGRTIRIEGRCTPCCTTPMYVERANEIALKNDILTEAHRRIMEAYQAYVDLIGENGAMSDRISADTAFFIRFTLEPPRSRRTFGYWKSNRSTPGVSGSLDQCIGHVFFANQCMDEVDVSVFQGWLRNLKCDTTVGEMDLRFNSSVESVRFHKVTSTYGVNDDEEVRIGLARNSGASFSLLPGEGAVIEFQLARFSPGALNQYTSTYMYSIATKFKATLGVSLHCDAKFDNGSTDKWVEIQASSRWPRG